jgi:hypothetical protein
MHWLFIMYWLELYSSSKCLHITLYRISTTHLLILPLI